jgi:hypothetical protein
MGDITDSFIVLFFVSDRGQCHFYGQHLWNTSMRQIVNLISPVDHLLIDNQTVMFNFSAWTGGYATELDNAAVSLFFLINRTRC